MHKETTILSRPEASWAELGFHLGDTEVERQDDIYLLSPRPEEQTWETMEKTCPPVAAVLVKRHRSVSAAGFTVVEGLGTKAALYAAYARAVMASMEGWTSFVLELLAAEKWGWRFFEAEPRHDPITVDGKGVWIPRTIRAYEPWHGAFTADRNFVLRSSASLSGQEELYETNFAHGFHEDQARWILPSFGDSASPYGQSSLRPAWMLSRIYFEALMHGAKRMPLSLGLLEVDGSETDKVFSEIARQAKKTFETMVANGILIKAQDLRFTLSNDVALPEGYRTWLELLAADIFQALTGSHLAQAIGQRSTQASARTHEKSTDSGELCLARWAADQTRHRLIEPWLRLNGFDPTPEELPRFKSGLEPAPTAEQLEVARTVAPTSVDWGALLEGWGVPLLVAPDEVVFEPPAMPAAFGSSQGDEEPEEDDQDEEAEGEDG